MERVDRDENGRQVEAFWQDADSMLLLRGLLMRTEEGTFDDGTPRKVFDVYDYTPEFDKETGEPLPDYVRTVLMTIKPQTGKSCKAIIDTLDKCSSMKYEDRCLTLSRGDWAEDGSCQITSYDDKGRIVRDYSQHGWEEEDYKYEYRDNEKKVSYDAKLLSDDFSSGMSEEANLEHVYYNDDYKYDDKKRLIRYERKGSGWYCSRYGGKYDYSSRTEEYSYGNDNSVELTVLQRGDKTHYRKVGNDWKKENVECYDGDKKFYDEKEHLVRVEHKDGSVTFYNENECRVITEHKDGSKTFYDEEGNLSRVEHKDGSKTFYNKGGRVIRIEHSNGSRELYSYDKNGKQHVKIVHSKQEIADKISDVLAKMGIKNSTPKSRKREAAVEMQ